MGQGGDVGQHVGGARGAARLRRRHAAGAGRPGRAGLPHRRAHLLRRRPAVVNPRRLYAPAVLGTLAAGGLAFFAASRTWAHVRIATYGLPSDSVDVTGTDAQPLVSALALVAVTAALAVLAASPRVRRVVGSVHGRGDPDRGDRRAARQLAHSTMRSTMPSRHLRPTPGSGDPDFTPSAWKYVAVFAFVLAALLGGVTAKLGARWPTMAAATTPRSRTTGGHRLRSPTPRCGRRWTRAAIPPSSLSADHDHEENSPMHGSSPAAWTAVLLCLAGITIGGVALIPDPHWLVVHGRLRHDPRIGPRRQVHGGGRSRRRPRRARRALRMSDQPPQYPSYPGSDETAGPGAGPAAPAARLRPGSAGPAGVRPPAYGQPAYGQPAYGQPAYGQPAYGQPGSGYGYGYPPPPRTNGKALWADDRRHRLDSVLLPRRARRPGRDRAGNPGEEGHQAEQRRRDGRRAWRLPVWSPASSAP